MNAVAGKCLCGAVCFETATELSCGICHCSICRQWGGGLPFAGVKGEVILKSADSLQWWKSSGWGERGFCNLCGSSLFCRAPGMSEWMIAVGALDDKALNNLKIVNHIYIDDKPDFYDFADDAPRQTGAEFTAQTLAALAHKFGNDFLQDALQQSRDFHGEKFTAEVEKLISQN